MILINMDMPTSCGNCWALDDYGDYPRCRITEEQRGYTFPIREKRMDNCPLIPVPEHGRLADLDKIENQIAQLSPEGYTTGMIRLILDCAPTVIPAEEGE